jgi:hypothetical protein
VPRQEHTVNQFDIELAEIETDGHVMMRRMRASRMIEGGERSVN